MRDAVFFIPEEGIAGLKNILFRKDIDKTAHEYGIPYEKVKQELKKTREENPGKKTVIVFSEDNKGPALLVETRDAFFVRLQQQADRGMTVARVSM